MGCGCGVLLCGKKAQEGESKEHMGKSLGEGKGRNATINLVHQIRRNNVHRRSGEAHVPSFVR